MEVHRYSRVDEHRASERSQRRRRKSVIRNRQTTSLIRHSRVSQPKQATATADNRHRKNGLACPPSHREDRLRRSERGRTRLFSTFKHQASGKPLRYWFIDYEGYWAAGGDSNPKIRPKDFIKWVNVETTPLPAWEPLPEHRRQSRIRQGVREIEQFVAEERKRDDRKVIGVQVLFERDPRSRSDAPNDSGPQLAAVAVQAGADEIRGGAQVQPSRRARASERSQPLCHSSTKEGYLAYREKYRAFRDEYIKASNDYRQGMWEREFPTGSFRPPLIRLCTNDEM